MPRHKRTMTRVYVEVGVDEDILAKVKLELFDPARQAVPLGAMTELVNELLSEWLKRRGMK